MAGSESKRRGVSAEEKMRELWRAGEARPRCKCHAEPMHWERRVGHGAGGVWRCAVKNRQAMAERRRLKDRGTPHGRGRAR